MKEKGEEWTRKFLESGKDRPESRRYAHRDIVRRLEEMSSHKCFYCEAKLNGRYEVDHHVEVSVDRKRAYDWDNLYLCCASCNREKLDESTIPSKEVLDPCKDSEETISQTISFVDEQIVSIEDNERGNKTIQKYRLDTEHLDLLRMKQLKKICEEYSYIKDKMTREGIQHSASVSAQWKERNTVMRIAYIDKLKGMAIMLVVMGHVAEWGCGIHGTPFNEMYSSFHMPLFMFLSGIFAFKGIKMFSGWEVLAFLRKKAMRIVVPFVMVGGIYSAMRFGYPWGTLTGEAGGYWFLPALFYDMLWGLVAVYAAHLITPPYAGVTQ